MSWADELAEAQIPAPVKRKLDSREKRLQRLHDERKREEEDEILLGFYRKAEKARREALLAGPHGKEIKGLIEFLKTMTLSSADALVSFVERAKWVRDLSKDDREAVWQIVFRGISRLRERNGLPFWEDAIGDESPKVFDRIEALLR